jgi:hypothetical protein
MASDKQQISIWLPRGFVRWLRVRAAERGISRSQLIEDLIAAEQREER